MGLRTRALELQFLKGIETKTDPKLQLQGELRELENCVFERIGRLDKRTGFSKLSNSIIGGGTISAGKAISRFRDQLILFTGKEVYAYSESLEKWRFIDNCRFTAVNNHEIHQDNWQQLNPTVAYSNGFEVHAYESNRPTSGATYTTCYTVIDSATRTIIVPETILSGTGSEYSKPKLFVFNNEFVMICHDTVNGKVVYFRCSTTDPSTGFGPAYTITSSYSNTYGVYDACQATNRIYVPFIKNDGYAKVVYLDNSWNVSSETTHENVERDWKFISCWSDASDRVWVVDGYSTGSVTSSSGNGINLLQGPNFSGASDRSTRNATTLNYPTTSRIDYWAARGTTICRIPFMWQPMQPTLSGALDSTELSKLDTAARYASSLGMKVIINCHCFGSWDAADSGTFKLGYSIAASHFVDLWTRLANQFKDDTNIWFGLMNEPHDLGRGLSGTETVYSSNVIYMAQLYKSTAAAIRATGATNKILLEGEGWNNAQYFNNNGWYDDSGSYMTSGQAIHTYFTDPGNNWAVDVHNYGGSDHGNPASNCVNSTILRTRMNNVITWCKTYGYKCVVGEWAVTIADPVGETCARDFMQYLVDNQDVVLGWCWWEGRSGNSGTTTTGWTDSAYNIADDLGSEDARFGWFADFQPVGGSTSSNYSSSSRGACYNNALSTVTSLTALYSNANTDGYSGLYRCGGYTDTNTAHIFYEHDAVSTRNIFISRTTLTTGGTAGYAIDAVPAWKRAVGLAAQPFKLSDGTICVPTAHESQLQSTYFVYDNDGYVLAKILPGNAGALESDRYLNRVATKDTDVFLMPNTVKGTVRSETGLFFSLLGAHCSELDLSGTSPARFAEIGENLLVAGGVVRSFDGNRLNEHNFYLYPEGLSGTASNGDGYLAPSGIYRYKAVYTYLDNSGNQHSSTPSPTLTVNTGASDDTITINVPAPRVTDKDTVRIDLYRTTDNGSVYYKITGLGDEILHQRSSNVDVYSYVDEWADSEINGNEPLYTEGELSNSSPPGSRVCTVWKNRAWFVSEDDPYSIQYTKTQVLGRPVNVHDAFVIRANESGGEVVDLVASGDYLLVFQEHAVSALSGEGLNNAGGGVDFNSLQLITNDMGAKYTNTSVEVPDGIIFVSTKGIYLLSVTGAGIQAIGASISDYDGYTFVDSAGVSDRNQAVWIAQDATGKEIVLAYDWLVGQWSAWTGNVFQNCLSFASLPKHTMGSVVEKDRLAFVNSSGEVFVSDSTYTDDNNGINVRLSTGWYSPTGQQGYCYLHKLSLLGDYYSSHKLRVEVMFDYDESKKRTFVIDCANAIAATGDTKRYQWDLRVNKKCMSFKLTITSLEDTDRGLSLSGLRAMVADLPETNRLPGVHKQ